MIRRRLVSLTLFTLLLSIAVSRQNLLASALQDAPSPHVTPNDISGTYTFLRDGEFVQLTVEDGRLSGYVSRFGDTDSDKGEFIDQFFDKTSLEGDHLSFTTKVVHGVSYEFTGVVSTAAGKQPGQEAYRLIKGTLTQHTTDGMGKDTTMQRQVEFKSFPADLSKP